MARTRKSISILTVSGVEELTKDLNKFIKNVEVVADDEVDLLAQRLLKDMVREAPKKSGRLRKGLYVRKSYSRGKRKLNIGGKAMNRGYNYAVIQHEDESFKHTVGKAKFVEDPLRKHYELFKSRVRKRTSKW